MRRLPNELKTPFIQMENIFPQFTDKFLKIEEVEYLTHYVKFKMWPALFYVNSLCFLNSSIDWKLRFLNVGVRLYLHFSPQFTRILKTGFLNVALGWTFKFFPIQERKEFARRKNRSLVCISSKQRIFWCRIHKFSVCQQIHKKFSHW